MAKILIIGCGAIAYRHLQSLSIEKYADRHNTSLFLFDKYKSADELVKTFGSFCIDTRVILEENIYQYDFDIVIVCSSAGTRDAIDYSKLQTDFVLIEKPIANSIVELENLNFDDRCYVHLPVLFVL
jgi:predicted dehydrogenase